VPALIALSAIMAIARWGGSADPPVERIQGIYVQQAIELAAVGDRLVRLTRMTRFERCITRRPRAEDLNGHIVEALGLDVPGVGFVAGIVNVIEGCEPGAAGPAREARGG
jgi:hypothetical protein